MRERYSERESEREREQERERERESSREVDRGGGTGTVRYYIIVRELFGPIVCKQNECYICLPCLL